MLLEILIENTVYDLILGEVSIQNCIEYTEFENLFLIPSNVDLAAAEIELIGILKKQMIQKQLNGMKITEQHHTFIIVTIK